MRSFQRGFFCADLSIRYPYNEHTITVPMLLSCTLCMPMLLIMLLEALLLRGAFHARKYLHVLSRSWAVFSFGFIATYLSTEIGKNVVGRLRPHFYAACQPRMSNGSSCEEAQNPLAFIEDYYCSNWNLTESQLRELYVSFPSGHCSLSFYSMLLLAFYLHSIWPSGRSAGIRLRLRHIVQCLLLLLAWSIALSRVADYWHHWSDVLVGCLLGSIIATVTAVYVGGYAQRRQPVAKRLSKRGVYLNAPTTNTHGGVCHLVNNNFHHPATQSSTSSSPTPSGTASAQVCVCKLQPAAGSGV